MAYAAGMNPEQYSSSSLAEVIMTINGHQDRQTDDLRNTRVLVGVIHAALGGKEDILDLMPLPGDPTAEERNQAKIKELNRQREEMREFTMKMKARGLL